MQQAWHTLSREDVCKALKTDAQKGLDAAQARRRLAEVGPNRIDEGRATPPWQTFLKQFKDFLVLVLLGAAAISLALGEVYDFLAIIVIVILNAVMGFVQEYRAERSLQMLKRLAAPKATAIRGGRPEPVDSEALVPGDVVILESGSRVPADCRLLETTGLETDESPLTGESTPVSKDEEWVGSPEVELADRRNMVYMGTSVTRGWAKAVVVATGGRTEVGRIAHLLQESGQDETPLQKRLAQLGRYLVLLCLAIVAVVFVTGLSSGVPLYGMFLTAVSMAVAAIPEGLPAAVTVALALGVQRMARRRAIIRRLPAVETLGCATVICSDKTGTLTCNEMTVRYIWLPGLQQPIEVTGEGYRPEGTFRHGWRQLNPHEDYRLRAVLATGALCNHASLVHERGILGQGQWRIFGDPTEAALLVAARKGGIDPERLAQRHRLLGEVPFDSARRMMSVLCSGDPFSEGDAGSSLVTVLTKGAPDAVLSRCSHIADADGPGPLTDAVRRAVLARNESMAAQGLRVLAVAWRQLPASGAAGPDSSPGSGRKGAGGQKGSPDAQWENALVFGGLVAMHDPPRPEAKEAIRAARQAGVRTIMLTGDHPSTAAYIGRILGLLKDGDRVLTGQDLDRMDDAGLARALETTHAFARVSPAHKLRIVRALKSRNEIIAMTGDGVNDAPAIKEADIGIAMGKTGSDVTREASDMVLADDNFATIVAAIEEGRGIYANIRKFIRYLLTCNVGEVLTMFLAALAGLPLPLLPMQILWMNLVTDGLPAMALGVEPPEPGIMNRPPRRPGESVFAGGLHWQILYGGTLIGLTGLAGFLASLAGVGSAVERARTVAFTVLVGAQLIFVFQCRAESASLRQVGLFSNPLLLIAVLISGGMHFFVVYWPPLQAIFGTVALSAPDWGLIAGVVVAAGVLDRALHAAFRLGAARGARG